MFQPPPNGQQRQNGNQEGDEELDEIVVDPPAPLPHAGHTPLQPPLNARTGAIQIHQTIPHGTPPPQQVHRPGCLNFFQNVINGLYATSLTTQYELSRTHPDQLPRLHPRLTRRSFREDYRRNRNTQGMPAFLRRRILEMCGVSFAALLASALGFKPVLMFTESRNWPTEIGYGLGAGAMWSIYRFYNTLVNNAIATIPPEQYENRTIMREEIERAGGYTTLTPAQAARVQVTLVETWGWTKIIFQALNFINAISFGIFTYFSITGLFEEGSEAQSHPMVQLWGVAAAVANFWINYLAGRLGYGNAIVQYEQIRVQSHDPHVNKMALLIKVLGAILFGTIYNTETRLPSAFTLSKWISNNDVTTAYSTYTPILFAGGSTIWFLFSAYSKKALDAICAHALGFNRNTGLLTAEDYSNLVSGTYRLFAMLCWSEGLFEFFFKNIPNNDEDYENFTNQYLPYLGFCLSAFAVLSVVENKALVAAFKLPGNIARGFYTLFRHPQQAMHNLYNNLIRPAGNAIRSITNTVTGLFTNDSGGWFWQRQDNTPPPPPPQAQPHATVTDLETGLELPPFPPGAVPGHPQREAQMREIELAERRAEHQRREAIEDAVRRGASARTLGKMAAPNQRRHD